MRAGETVNCPRCGERTFVKSKKRMEGFTVTGEILVCTLCGAELGTPQEESAASSDSDPHAADQLAALLGDVSVEAKADLSPTEEFGRFCRNCVHFIEHPFKTLCGLNGSNADPMGECSRFQKKEK